MIKECYSFEELLAAKKPWVDNDGRKAKLAVIGDPVAHSLSPSFQQEALDHYKLPYCYVRVHVPSGKENLKKAIEKFEELGFIGINITLPHKQEAYEICHQKDEIIEANKGTDYLNKLHGISKKRHGGSRRVSHFENSAAERLKIVNTIHFKKEGNLNYLNYFNTDSDAFIASIEKAFFKANPLPKHSLKACLIGAGGVASVMLDPKIQTKVAVNYLINRTLHKAKEKVEALGMMNKPQILGFNDDGKLIEAIQQSQLIINATSLGLKDSDSLPLPESAIQAINKSHLVYDTIYRETAFLKRAKSQGAKTANGVSMLFLQGMRSFELWFSKELKENPKFEIKTPPSERGLYCILSYMPEEKMLIALEKSLSEKNA